MIFEVGSPEWHAFRADYVMSSDMGALVGANPYCSRDKLFEEKVSGETPAPNPHMWWGSYLEEPNRVAFSRLVGWETEPFRESMARGDIGANFDAKVVVPSGADMAPGEHPKWVEFPDGLPVEGAALLELKNAGFKWGKKNHPRGYPEYYWWQAQAQMHVSGLTQTLLVVKVGSAEMLAFVIQYDAMAMSEAAEEATAFMQEVRRCRK